MYVIIFSMEKPAHIENLTLIKPAIVLTHGVFFWGLEKLFILSVNLVLAHSVGLCFCLSLWSRSCFSMKAMVPIR